MVQENAQAAYDRREEEYTPDLMRQIERLVVLSVLDQKWREHLYEMDYLREGIGLRAMAQRDPLVEYQREGFDMFNAMMDGIKEESVGNLFNRQFEIQENPIVEEVGAGAQLAFGGNLPGVTTGAAPAAPAAPARRPLPRRPLRRPEGQRRLSRRAFPSLRRRRRPSASGRRPGAEQGALTGASKGAASRLSSRACSSRATSSRAVAPAVGTRRMTAEATPRRRAEGRRPPVAAVRTRRARPAMPSRRGPGSQRPAG